MHPDNKLHLYFVIEFLPSPSRLNNTTGLSFSTPHWGSKRSTRDSQYLPVMNRSLFCLTNWGQYFVGKNPRPFMDDLDLALKMREQGLQDGLTAEEWKALRSRWKQQAKVSCKENETGRWRGLSMNHVSMTLPDRKMWTQLVVILSHSACCNGLVVPARQPDLPFRVWIQSRQQQHTRISRPLGCFSGVSGILDFFGWNQHKPNFRYRNWTWRQIHFNFDF